MYISIYTSLSLSIYIYIYIYTHIHIHMLSRSSCSPWSASRTWSEASQDIVAIFYPFSQFCEIDISLLSLQTQPNTAPNLFQRGVEYGKYVCRWFTWCYVTLYYTYNVKSYNVIQHTTLLYDVTFYYILYDDSNININNNTNINKLLTMMILRLVTHSNNNDNHTTINSDTNDTTTTTTTTTY